MRKLLVTILILFALLLLSACGGETNFAALNEITSDSYATITLTVKTTLDGETLTSSFVITNEEGFSTVTYSVEQFTEIVAPAVPESYKTVLKGDAEIIGNAITSLNGDDVILNIDVLSTSGMNFKADYFQNAKTTGSLFSADVVFPELFLGYSLNCTNMKVSVWMLEDSTKIVITYTAENNSSVEMEYLLK